MNKSFTKADSLIANFSDRVSKIIKNKKQLINFAKKHKSPVYIYDKREVEENVRVFFAAFKRSQIEIQPFYALKSNPYDGLLKTVVREGAGLDVSSVLELQMAVKAKAEKIVFTGPGKTEYEFEEILKIKNSKITVHLESEHELMLLQKLANKKNKVVTCGIRVVPPSLSSWSKFGIPLTALASFFSKAKNCKNIKLEGIQFHISYSKSSKPYINAIKEISKYLKANFSSEMLEKVKFLDIGGGFYPEVFEAEYAWNKNGVLYYDEPKLLEKIQNNRFHPRGIKIKVQPINELAQEISKCIEKEIFPLVPSIQIYAEPGRFISHSSMHLLMQIADIKNENSVIVNAGWNAVGWEKYEYLNYAPIFNLTNFSRSREANCIVYGNLCLPDDIWGYYIHETKHEIGDVLILPYQGSYTYTYRQDFIRGVPEVVDL